MADQGPEGRRTMKNLQIVTPEEWEAARQRLLVREKEVSRAKDALAAAVAGGGERVFVRRAWR